MEEWIDFLLLKQMHHYSELSNKKKCPFHTLVHRRITRVQIVLDYFRSIHKGN
jgi:hypothetical protein